MSVPSFPGEAPVTINQMNESLQNLDSVLNHISHVPKGRRGYAYALPEEMSTPTEKGTQMTSEALVRPGDITAADSIDLLDQLKSVNVVRIEDKLESRVRTEMRKKREKEIWESYKAKATAYYNEIWRRCGNSSVGHNFVNLDAGQAGTIPVCDTCSQAKVPQPVPGPPFSSSKVNSANEYNENLIRALGKQLMKLDEEAGVITPPQDDDFIGLERKYLKKGRLFK